MIGLGEFLENNRPLLPSGFVEEWWTELLRLEAVTAYDGIEDFAQHMGLNPNEIRSYIDHPDVNIPSVEKALLLAKKSRVPLHPRFTWFWENIAPEDFDYLRRRLANTGPESKFP